MRRPAECQAARSQVCDEPSLEVVIEASARFVERSVERVTLDLGNESGEIESTGLEPGPVVVHVEVSCNRETPVVAIRDGPHHVGAPQRSGAQVDVGVRQFERVRIEDERAATAMD